MGSNYIKSVALQFLPVSLSGTFGKECLEFFSVVGIGVKSTGTRRILYSKAQQIALTCNIMEINFYKRIRHILALAKPEIIELISSLAFVDTQVVLL
jgi:hypothetical protein